MKSILLFLAMHFTSGLLAQHPADFFTHQIDVGKPALKGSTAFNVAEQSYILRSGGYNIWFNRDEFHYSFRKLTGDFILTAHLKLIGKGTNPHRKIGWMIRANEQDDAAHISAAVHGDGLAVLQWRKLRGAYMRDPEDEIFSIKKNPEIIQLERIGKTYIMRAANPGEPLQEIGRTESKEMPDGVLAGIFLCSHQPEVMEEGKAWNVRIEKTVPDNYDGYRDGVLGSRMEIMNVFNGQRKIVYTDSLRFEAPNWMADDKHLLFNQSGGIFTVPLEGGKATRINTGEANSNNNDHVISFDGKWLAISSHRSGMPGGGSTIYYLPISGGTPQIVTDSTPSYLHGWSPDGKEVVYTAQRISKSPVYNIYKKPIRSGGEIQLTSLEKGLADGPEYSPDGKFIYYNSTQSGTMQLWRMKPDGSGKEQLTFDEYNNWFPHVSPDNKWIAFLSYPTTVDPAAHPFYKRVMLRLMPVNGTASPRVIAYLFGGQGTINTPSWSPDSKQIAFVSNSAALHE
jgi:TolB protein